VPEHTVSKTLTLTNVTEQPLSYNVVMSQKKRANAGGTDPLTCLPARGTIAAGASAEVEVRFSPDHQSTGFGCLMTVDVPSEIETHEIALRGRGWASAMFIVGGDAAEEEARADKMAHVLPDLFQGLGQVETKNLLLPLLFTTPLPEGVARPGTAAKPKKPKKGEEEEAPAEPGPLAVGVLECGNAGDAGAGEVTIDALSAEAQALGFAMDPAGGHKGLAPGDLKQVRRATRAMT
jgi:hypothetical protein